MESNGHPVPTDRQLAADFVERLCNDMSCRIADLMANDAWCKQLAGFVAERMDGMLASRVKDVVLMAELEREKVRAEGPWLRLLREIRAQGIQLKVKNGRLMGGPRNMVTPEWHAIIRKFRDELTRLVKAGW